MFLGGPYAHENVLEALCDDIVSSEQTLARLKITCTSQCVSILMFGSRPFPRHAAGTEKLPSVPEPDAVAGQSPNLGASICIRGLIF
jgi:hypothetical protein